MKTVPELAGLLCGRSSVFNKHPEIDPGTIPTSKRRKKEVGYAASSRFAR
jgi:hypothetical protein